MEEGSPVGLGEEGDTFSFSVAAAPTTTTTTAAAARLRRGGGTTARGGSAVAGKTRGGGGGAAAAGRGRGGAAAGRRTAAGRGGAAATAAAAAAADEAAAARRAAARSGGGDDENGAEDDEDEDDDGDDDDEDESNGASADDGAETGGGGEQHSQHQPLRNGATWTSHDVQAAKESMVNEVYLELLDDILHEVVFEMHRRAKTGLMCFDCEDRYTSDIVDKNGYDVFGQAVSGKIVTGEVRFDCLNCSRTVVASRYAPHLEKCMGIGRVARNSSRIASRRMKVNYEDDLYAQAQPYIISPSLDEDNEDDDDDDATYGEQAKHRVSVKDETGDGAYGGVTQEHQGGSNGSTSTSIRSGTAKTGKRAASTVATTKKGTARKPLKKKGRVAAEVIPEESPLGSFGGDDDQPIAFGDDIDVEVVEEMEAGAVPRQGIDAFVSGIDLIEPEEKTTAKRRTIKSTTASHNRPKGGNAK